MKERGEERGDAKGEDEELNAAANLSVWKGIMPVLNIAARLGIQREREKDRVNHASQYKKRCLYSTICFLNLSALVRNPQNVSSCWWIIMIMERQKHSDFHVALWLFRFMHEFDFLSVFSTSSSHVSLPVCLPPSLCHSIHLPLSLPVFALVSGLPVFFHLALSAFSVVFS